MDRRGSNQIWVHDFMDTDPAHRGHPFRNWALLLKKYYPLIKGAHLSAPNVWKSVHPKLNRTVLWKIKVLKWALEVIKWEPQCEPQQKVKKKKKKAHK